MTPSSFATGYPMFDATFARHGVTGTTTPGRNWTGPLLAAGCCLAAACSQQTPTSAAARSVQQSASRPDQQRPALAPAADVEQARTQLQQLAPSLAPGLEPVEPGWTGTLTERSSHSHMVVLDYGRCYRVLAAATANIEDLDIALFDSNDVERLRDQSRDRYPTLGIATSICPGATAAYRIEARAFKGAGHYALQLFRSEPSM